APAAGIVSHRWHGLVAGRCPDPHARGDRGALRPAHGGSVRPVPDHARDACRSRGAGPARSRGTPPVALRASAARAPGLSLWALRPAPAAWLGRRRPADGWAALSGPG